MTKFAKQPRKPHRYKQQPTKTQSSISRLSTSPFFSISEVSEPATHFLRFHHVGDRRRSEVLLWIILKFSLTSQRLSSHHSDLFSVENKRVHQSAGILVPYPHSLQCKILHHACGVVCRSRLSSMSRGETRKHAAVLLKCH